MMNLIKSNFYRYSKNRWGYLYIVLIGLYTIFMPIGNLVSSDKTTGVFQLYGEMNGILVFGWMILGFLIVVFHEDINSGAIKNILGRGISRTKYIIASIISFSVVSILVWLLSTIIIVVGNTLTYKFGVLNDISSVILTYILSAVCIVAFISIAISIITITKSVILGFFLTFFITGFSFIVKILSLLVLKREINIDYISFYHYLNNAISNTLDTKSIFIGFGLAIAYIIVFSIIGIVVLKKRDVK